MDKMQKGPLIRSRVPLHFVPKKKKKKKKRREQVVQKDIVIGQVHMFMASLFCIGQDETWTLTDSFTDKLAQIEQLTHQNDFIDQEI